MSLLMFWRLEDQILIHVDTLMTFQSGERVGYTNKYAILPHLETVVVATGIHDLFLDWCRMIVSGYPMARTVDDLAAVAVEQLPALWAQYKPWNDRSTTIYHFGYSSLADRYVYDVFRSESGFAHERPHLDAPQVFGYKPTEPPVGLGKPTNSFEFTAFAEAVREAQRTRLLVDRVHIGGDLIEISMKGRQITATRLSSFGDDDYQ